MPKKYKDEEGNFYDAILYTGFNLKDVIKFLDNKPIIYSYSMFSDLSNDGISKTYIGIKLDINDGEEKDYIYLFTYEYLVYDIKKKYIYTYRYELFNNLFKEVNIIMTNRGQSKNIKKYKKKPVIIEALEYTEDNYEYAIQFVGKENCIVKVYDALDPNKESHKISFAIKTLEGDMIANKGDFIIKGVNGEFYPCKPDIFWKTYEEV